MANTERTITLNINTKFDGQDAKAGLQELKTNLANLKMPKELSNSFTQSFNSVNKAIDNYMEKLNKGVTNASDAKGLAKSAETVVSEFNKLDVIVKKITNEVASDSKNFIFPQETVDRIAKITNEIAELQEKINNFNTNGLNNVKEELDKIKGKGSQTGAKEVIQLFEEGKLEEAQEKLNKIIATNERLKNSAKTVKDALSEQMAQLKAGEIDSVQYKDKILTGKEANTLFTRATTQMGTASSNLEIFSHLQNAMKEALTGSEDYQKQLEEKEAEAAKVAADATDELNKKLEESLTRYQGASNGARVTAEQIGGLAIDFQKMQKQLDQFKYKITYFFSLNNMINLFKRAVRDAYNTVKELDKAMTETAVVTNFTVGDMWKQLPEYTKRANELGVSTKAAYEAATLYYQQGLKTNEVMAMSNETLKMARIAGLDAAVATDRMTNAIRGFNMEINETNAQRIDDVYSRLAAISASNVDEISTAMTKVASLAHSANMEFETTSAFLAQMIETTRESAETAGTALKTVVARFSEVKKLVNSDQLKGEDEEGQVIDVNKVSAALRTADIDLNKYFLGEIGLDDVFIELASKWDSLTVLQQRYIATMAAGSRQQSRFIAMMSDYARTQELVTEAYNANGAAAKQFEKTQESMQSKLEKLRNAWHEFTMGITNSTIIKKAVSGLTTILNVINKITSGFGLLNSGIGGTFNSLLKFSVAITGLRGAKVLLGGASYAFGGLMNPNPEIQKIGTWSNGVANATSGKGFGAYTFGPWAGLTRLPGKTKNGIINLANLVDFNTKVKPALQEGNFSSDVIASQIEKYPQLTDQINKYAAAQATAATAATASGEAAAAASKGTMTLGAALKTILPYIAAVVAALAAIYIAYKLWERFSFSGQIKTSKEWAKNLDKINQKNQEIAKTTKDISNKYKELTKNINEATTAISRQEAIAEKNKYLSDLLTSNPEYAEYIITNRKNGQVSYELDEARFNAEAIKNTQEAAKTSAINAQLANTLTTALEADKLRSEELVYRADPNSAYYYDPEMEKRFRENRAQADLKDVEVEKAMTSIFQQLIPENIDDKTADAISQVMAQNFDGSAAFREIQNKVSIYTEDQLRDKYKELYGFEAAEDLDKKAIQNAVEYKEYQNSLKENIDDIDELFSDEIGKQVFDTIIGKYNVAPISEGELEDFFNKNSEVLQKVLNITNIDQLREQFNEGLKVNAERTAKAIRNIVINVKKYQGLTAEQFIKLTEGLSTEEVNTINTLSENIKGYNTEFKDAVLAATTQAMVANKFDDSELQKLVSNLGTDDLDNFKTLTKAAKSTNEEIKELATNLIEVEKNGRFSNENLLSNYLMSNSFEDVNKELEKFVEENGKITGANIKEVAENYDTLNTLLKENIISATGLAKILNSGISPASISNSLIAAANILDDIDDTMLSIIDNFNNFDPGYNEHDIANFYNSAYESINDIIERNAYGNNQIQSYYNEIFSGELGSNFKGSTNDEYAQYIKEQTNTALQFIEANKNNFNDAAEKVFGEWSQNKNLLPEYTNMFRVENGQVFYDTLGKTSDELLEIIEKYGQYNGQKISRKTAEALFGYLKEQSPEFSRILSQVDIQKGLSEWYNELKTDINGGKYFTQSDIDAFALLYGISAEEAEAQIKETYGILATKVKADNAYDLLKEIGYEDTLKASTYIVKENDKEESFDALDFNKLYNVLAPLGKLDELDNVAKKIIEDTGIKKAVANIDGELREFDINTGQSLTEAYEAAIEKTPIEVNGLGEISAAIQDILSVLDPSGKHRDNTEAYTQEQNRSKVNLVQEQNSETDFANAQKKRAYEILGNVSRTLDLTNEKIKEIREDIDNNNIVAAYEKIKTSIADKTESAEEALLEELILFNPKVDTSTLETAIQNATTITTSIVAAATEEAAQSMWRKQARAQAIQQVKKENGWDKLADKEFNKYLDADLEEHIQKLSEQNYRDISSVVEAAGGFNYLKDAFTPKTPTKIPTTGSTTPAIDNTEDKDKGGSDKETEWKNEFDWLYNLMEDLAELQRQQNLLQQQEQDLIRSDNATGHDLYRNLISQYANLSSQLEHQQTILDKRSLEMEELMRTNDKYSEYAWWEDNTVNIDWDKIEAIEDQETYNAVKAFVDEMETVQSKMDEAESSLLDIEAEMYELERKYRDAYIEFENRVKEALIQQYQDTIDQLSTLNETITESNNNILNSIQEQLDLERQIRDNTQTEKDIADKQARLAYLQRDTTGGNQAEILKLQQEIEDAQQNYTDALIDQNIQKLQNDNEKAAEQRQQQITLMQEQLDWNKEQGTFNQEVHDIIERSTNSKGELINGSELEELLKTKDNWTAMTEAERAVWTEKLDDEHDYWNAYYDFLNGDSDGTFWKAVESLKEAINGINMGRTNLGKKHGGSSYDDDDDDSTFEAGGLTFKWDNGLRPEGTFGLRQSEDDPEKYNVVVDKFRESDIILSRKTGGTVSYTGLAMLHGTPSEPEYVLNARQTEAFLKLADVLPSFMESGINPTNITGGNVYVELNMNVDQISSDYDVDRIVDRVKTDIETAASYRNISSISLLR